jgi:hypothetical protein
LADHWAEDGEAARYKPVWLQPSILVIQKIVNRGEWSIERTGVSLFGLQKLFEVGL